MAEIHPCHFIHSELYPISRLRLTSYYSYKMGQVCS